MKPYDSKCWRFWMACESDSVAAQFASWMQLYYGGAVSRRPTLRFRNVRYAGRIVVFDATYIARGANMTDINRVLAKMCLDNGGRWAVSFYDLMYVMLWSEQHYGESTRGELVEMSNADYERAVKAHYDVMQFMGGTPMDA
ncbi:hypothetical protein O4160_22185 [Rhodococcus sp. IEGM 1401]|uniref:hypothetical protein n=1 Tax=unclassified Rhodococcus (in: high G+C Gram-positive bacteria) TaxID=192944 RepID=UPI0022B2C338|nr:MULTISPECIES: hypothetical protein [unclassified Rhodococcus (in: high G+C Gram-positive bacteria)]MCZ4563552.1 hypothetical protein [Rhodococcus sp. IEGM 1401]MDI9923692.1 hypothetical protein [Rhodococcus sp. IEGM 1372]MDV8036167.1 hypothetical protein [Rhodococcus sp. IEGM 1414]